MEVRLESTKGSFITEVSKRQISTFCKKNCIRYLASCTLLCETFKVRKGAAEAHGMLM